MTTKWERRVSALFVLLISGTVYVDRVRLAGAGHAQPATATPVASTVASQTLKASDEALLGTLPPELREAGAAILREKDESLREQTIWRLMQAASGASGGDRGTPR